MEAADRCSNGSISEYKSADRPRNSSWHLKTAGIAVTTPSHDEDTILWWVMASTRVSVMRGELIIFRLLKGRSCDLSEQIDRR